MSRRFSLCLAALAALLTSSAAAQTLAARIARLGDGSYMLTYGARPEVCGDGRTIILRGLGQLGDVIYSGNAGSTIYGGWSEQSPGCTTGPVRLRFSIEDHRIGQLWPGVGRTGIARADVDLGVVACAAVTGWLLGVARTSSGETASRALLAAALADSTRIATRMLAIAQDRSLAAPNREQGLKWAALVAVREANDTVAQGVRAIAADDAELPEVRERAIRVTLHPDDDAFLRRLYGQVTLKQLKERIIGELGDSPGTENVEWLVGVAHNEREDLDLRDRAIRVIGEDQHDIERLRVLYSNLSNPDLQDRVVRTAADEGSAASIQWIESVAENTREPGDVRDRAIRDLGDGGQTAYLRRLYSRLDRTDLKDRVLLALGDAGGPDNLQFLRQVVLDSKEGMDLRDRAVRALDEAGVRSDELVRLYDATTDRDLRDRLIRLMADRGDTVSRAKLARIARDDPDPDLRERAARRGGN